MKKLLSVLLIMAMVFSLSACGAGDNAKDNKDAADNYKAALLLNGNLGDKSFFDSANEGLTRLQDELGKDKFSFKVEQMGATSQDESKWQPTMEDYCEDGKYDVIIVGTWQMAEILAKAAKKYPEQKFIFFDETFDFDAFKAKFEDGEEVPKNIYNVLYKQNEVSFLVGAAAALMTSDATLDKVNANDKVIGFLGGMENAVIKDFLIGYIQGAKYADPEVQVQTAYVGNFFDSAAGKDLALTQYQSGGVDVGYNVAGSAGLGQIEAAVEADKYAFGVDSDQAALLPDMAANIPSSALKNVGNSLERAIKLDMEEKLEFGVAETLGLSDQGVELVKGEHYETVVPQNIRDYVEQLEKDIISGKIVVETAAGKTDEEIKDIIDQLQ
ncbi:BMP family ABC transporter substrate-binding protein [Sedimentibacter sp. zth1]|uniref:BMP family ABC transporter substrate-binding protein n=1 Tax=Sedimentibacter sp. zth1 TaxID=2816908 RepID=UPI001A935F02|nr:BMP family ABC transporter substrate-binding protein [Sedimentibacter sp. zth1]QSX04947.1 BMP family ABC transporter substrate-binding protein [Sedimentibacter sp. zth1]